MLAKFARPLPGLRIRAIPPLPLIRHPCLRFSLLNTAAREEKGKPGTTAPQISGKEMLELFKQVPFTPLDDKLSVEQLGYGSARIRLHVDSQNLRPGGTVSGPVLFTLCDLVAWAVVCSLKGKSLLSVTTSTSIDFLNKPRPEHDLIGVGQVLKNGKRLVVSRVSVYSDGDLENAVAHASVTYSVPPPRATSSKL
mmetsp:Transcript_3250/g.6327  ORF Transcript_3250/g.6327 Transcript_3250/m.6327 type:complete len:195 (-) Transcript_3250:99-683(-)